MNELSDYINITEEDLNSFSLEELADLKVELDDLTAQVDYLLSQCEEIINN